jgi:hypothetical protein
MDWEKLEILARRGEEQYLIARPCYVTKIYGDPQFIPAMKDMLSRWIEERKGEPIFHVNRNSTQPKPADARAITRMKSAFSKPKNDDFFWLNTAPEFNIGAHSIRLELYPDSEHLSSALSIQRPIEDYVGESAEKWIDLFKETMKAPGILHASAGYGMSVVWGLDFEQMAGPRLLAVCKKHLGLDLPNNEMGSHFRKTMAGPNWLTYVGPTLKDQLQKPPSPPPEGFKEVPLEGGVILVAGEEAPVGEVNRKTPDLAPLRYAAKVVRPLRTTFWMDIPMPIEYMDTETSEWLARLDDA